MIETERLVLRPWRAEDRAPYAAMCASRAVMRHLGGPNGDAEIDAAIARNQRSQRRRGHCFWAVERKDDRAFLGFCGLRVVDDVRRHVHGEVEIGWRLVQPAWHRGYARESAEASLAWCWETLGADRVIAFTVPANTASWGLMRRLGMARRPDLDFGHPDFAPGHPLHAHIVYAAARPAQISAPAPRRAAGCRDTP